MANDASTQAIAPSEADRKSRPARAAASDIVVRQVHTWRDRRRFQRVPWLVYVGEGGRDPNWVPPILSQERELLGWGKWRRHPFYDNAESRAFLAERRGQPIGRLLALVNHVHNRRYEERLGFFGFFECIDDEDAAAALFDAGEAWLRSRGMTAVRGPVNPSLNHTCGLLVDNHDNPPRFLMTYNPPYYQRLLQSCGLAPAQDLYTYEATTAQVISIANRFKRATEAALARADVVIRPLDRKRLAREVQTYLDIYNSALDGTWGFAPLQPREAEQIAGELRHVIVPELVLFAEVAGKPVGAVLALLDYNQILRRLNGRLFPTGLLRVLIGQRKIDTMRTMAITMDPQYQHSGLAAVLMSRLIEPASRRGIKHWEFSWILQSNMRSRQPLEKCGMSIAKTYRLYDKRL